MKPQISHHQAVTGGRAGFDTRTADAAGLRVLPFNPFHSFEPNV